jgi:hypothetical protein
MKIKFANEEQDLTYEIGDIVKLSDEYAGNYTWLALVTKNGNDEICFVGFDDYRVYTDIDNYPVLAVYKNDKVQIAIDN